MRCNRTLKKMALFHLLSYTIKRVHFALGQYSDRSEKTAKCGNCAAPLVPLIFPRHILPSPVIYL